MNNLYRFPSPPHLPFRTPMTEVEAIALARDLADRLKRGRRRLAAETMVPSPGHDAFNALVEVGLLGVAVPEDAGGPDLLNGAIAEILSILAEAEPDVAEAFKCHIEALDVLRGFEGDGRRSFFLSRAMEGDRFALMVPGRQDRTAQTSGWPRRERDDTSLSVPLPADRDPSIWRADWVLLPHIDLAERLVVAVMPGADLSARIEEARDRECSRLVLGRESLASAGTFVLPASVALSRTIRVLRPLLEGAIDLGMARAMFDARCRALRARDPCVGTRKQDDGGRTVATIGRIAAHIAGASALLGQAGQAIDAVQISADGSRLSHACQSATAASLLAADLVRQVTEDLKQDQIPDGAEKAGWIIRAEREKDLRKVHLATTSRLLGGLAIDGDAVGSSAPFGSGWTI